MQTLLCGTALVFKLYCDYTFPSYPLKKIYQATTEESALQSPNDFRDKWDEQYPQISCSWTLHWEKLNTLFNYPPDIRKAIYTTNAIESLNSVIRKATKNRKGFPTDDSALKVIYLAIRQASEKWRGYPNLLLIQTFKLQLRVESKYI